MIAPACLANRESVPLPGLWPPAVKQLIDWFFTMQVAFGEVHKIVGADPALGAWDLGSAPAMAWSEGDVWRLDASLPAGSAEFKVGPQVF